MTSVDVVVRGGRIVDGTGAPPFTADIAITDGAIAEVGKIGARGSREIDADGAMVIPGFVDIHTHYDAQATWDSRLQPSSWHGVTTVVMGNCGVGFAPVRPADHSRLVELMEGVEDIPGVALTEGLSWEWQSFPEFLDAVERRPHDLDVAAQVPHAALRVYAMGSRAAAHQPATDDDVAVMAGLARAAIEAGALGFSTSRTLNHKSVSGELIPSYAAGTEELVRIAAAIGETGRGVLQLVTDWQEDPADEFDLITSMARASGRPMSFAVAQNTANPHRWPGVLAFIERLNAAGHRVRGQVAARGIGVILGLQCTLHPFSTNPVWQRIAHLPTEQQARLMADPATRAELLAAHTGAKDPNRVGGGFLDRWEGMFELTDPPNYEPSPDESLAARAAALGRRPEELACEILISDNGRGLIYSPFANYAHGDLDAVHDMLAHPFTVPGLSDGGAHVGTICDGSFPTFLLQHWARDRDHDRLSLPYVVARQSRATAEAVGLLDRGCLRPGYKADLNVVDFDNLALHRPEIRFDLPAGGRRLLQHATGYLHTLVSGIETYRDGQPTGALPGRLIRGPRQPR